MCRSQNDIEEEKMRFHHSELSNTYSIVARDAQTGDFGVAVQTHQMGVGLAVPWLEPGVGAIATQSLTNISFGPMGLAMLRHNVAAPKVVEALVASDENAHRRQLAVVDRHGKTAAWTGEGCIPEAGHKVGEGYSVQANMMLQGTVVEAMAAAYEAAEGDLAKRMLAAMQAAQAEGGDIRGMQSAALRVVKGDLSADPLYPDWQAIYDLRVDEHDEPLSELARLVRLRRAQIINIEGHELLEQDQREAALARWIEACQLAPELEEMPFGQAVTLADKPADVTMAAAILQPVLAADPLREQWLELIRRLQICGLLEREGTSDELLEAMGFE
jgi:uncharacterized Ntn-hydrolase superfamily protein